MDCNQSDDANSAWVYRVCETQTVDSDYNLLLKRLLILTKTITSIHKIPPLVVQHWTNVSVALHRPSEYLSMGA